MSEGRPPRSLGRRLLFAGTDPRSLTVGLVGLSGLFAYSLAFGEPTRLVYPWNAPPSERPILVEEALPTAATELVTEAASETPAESSRAADPTETAAASAIEDAVRAAVETAEGATDGIRKQPPRATADAAARVGTPQPGTAPPADPERQATVSERPTAEPESPTRSPAARPPVDLTPAGDALDRAETALQRGDADAAAASVERARTVLTGPGVMNPAEAGRLRARLEDVERDVALKRLEDDIGAFTEQARAAQEAGDYPLAIGLLQSLVVRADRAPAAHQPGMRQLLSLFRVSETVDELVEACEFEREHLGRTEPCVAR